MTVYADTSVFVSIYLNDVHTREARLALEIAPTLLFTPLHEAEFAHAVAQHVFRGEITARQASQFHRLLDLDRASGLWEEVGLPGAAFRRCTEVARRHVAGIGARTLDSLHVACALELHTERFWTFDQRQRRLAKLEGLPLVP